jgi:hypothetical protein
MIALLSCCVLGLFDVQRIPLETPNAVSFFAQVSEKEGPDLFVLDGRSLHRHDGRHPALQRTVNFAPGTSAVDVGDVDGDGIAEAVAIEGDKVLRYALDGEGDGKGDVLFSSSTQFRLFQGTPFLHVMIVEYEGAPALALAGNHTLELRRADGSMVASFPIGEDAPQQVSLGRPFSARAVHAPQVGGDSALELRVDRFLAFKPLLPEELKMVPLGLPLMRSATPRQASDARPKEVKHWPWFPLQPGQEEKGRVRYALDRGGDTFVCLPVLDLESGAVPSRAAYGPAKRYPGAPLMLDAPMPDFTGDGYADLALWHAPTPTLSPGALAKAMTSGTWPIWIRIHPFVPERGRFASRSSGGIEVRAPLTWFLEGYGRVPLRCLVSEDFDGDGRDDLAFAAQPTLFQMWRYEQRGLSDPPFFSHRFQESLQSVAQLCDVRGDGRNSLVLRGERSLFVLTPVMEGKEE